MEINQIISDMIERQKKLDEAMYNGNNAIYNRENTYLALIDEIGELNHELKKEWCWWKKTQKPVDRERVLGELADVWHFVLNIFYHEYPFYVRKGDYFFGKRTVGQIKESYTNYIYSRLTDVYSDHELITNTTALSLKLGFTMEEVYEAYKKKNQENYERLKNGY